METAAATLTSIDRAPNGPPPAPPDPARQAAEEFEAVFLSTVISRMFSSLPVDGPFGGGHAEATYRSFLADEYASEVARGGGIGIADEIHAELLRIQEARR